MRVTKEKRQWRKLKDFGSFIFHLLKVLRLAGIEPAISPTRPISFARQQTT